MFRTCKTFLWTLLHCFFKRSFNISAFIWNHWNRLPDFCNAGNHKWMLTTLYIYKFMWVALLTIYHLLSHQGHFENLLFWCFTPTICFVWQSNISTCNSPVASTVSKIAHKQFTTAPFNGTIFELMKLGSCKQCTLIEPYPTYWMYLGPLKILSLVIAPCFNSNSQAIVLCTSTPPVQVKRQPTHSREKGVSFTVTVTKTSGCSVPSGTKSLCPI